MAEAGSTSWTKLLLAAGGTVGVCAILYYLVKEEKKQRSCTDGGHSAKHNRSAKIDSNPRMSKDQVRSILEDVVNTQHQMIAHLQSVRQELGKDYSFNQVYTKVKQVHTVDPLQKYNLSEYDFGELLSTYGSDPSVRDALAKIMGASPERACASEKVKSITVGLIVSVHKEMLSELETIAAHVQDIREKESYEGRVVAIAAQTMVGSKIEETFHYTSAEIESAVFLHHTELGKDKAFVDLNVSIQQVMSKLLGSKSKS